MNDEPVANPSVLAPVGLPSVGDLLRSSLERYRAHWKLWVLIALPAAIIGGLHAFLSSPAMFVHTPSMRGMMALGLVLMVVQFFSTLALLTAVSEPVSVGEAYRRGARLFAPYLLIGLLSGPIILAGFTLFVIPGIIFAVWFGLAPYILVSEGTRGMNALLKSKAYVEGHFWSVFGRVFVLILISIVGGLLLNILAFSGVLPYGVSNVLTSLFLMPFAMIYCFKIYEGLKVVKGAVSDVYTTREKSKYIALVALGLLWFLGLMGVWIFTLFYYPL